MTFDTDVLQRLCALMEQQLEETRGLRSDVNDGFDRLNSRLDRMSDQLEDTCRMAETLWENHTSDGSELEPHMDPSRVALEARIDALEARVARFEAEHN